jgi:hypothetical protein
MRLGKRSNIRERKKNSAPANGKRRSRAHEGAKQTGLRRSGGEAKEIPMRTITTKNMWVIMLGVLAGLAPVATHAQAETSPDEYRDGGMATIIPEASVKPDFEGKFTMPYEVWCHGNRLVPGDYKVMVKTVGADKMVTLQRAGSNVVLHSHAVAPTSVSDVGHSAVMLRHGPGPSGHTLEGVYVENLKLVLFLDDSGHTSPFDKIFASMTRLPISAMN